MRVLLDTHTWAWAITRDTKRLSLNAITAIQTADDVLVSPVAIFEIGQKVRLGRWPEMAPYVHDLEQILIERGGAFAPLTPVVCLTASLLEWEQRDPFDRFMAATAIECGVPLVSADSRFDGLPSRQGWFGRIW